MVVLCPRRQRVHTCRVGVGTLKFPESQPFSTAINPAVSTLMTDLVTRGPADGHKVGNKRHHKSVYHPAPFPGKARAYVMQSAHGRT